MNKRLRDHRARHMARILQDPEARVQLEHAMWNPMPRFLPFPLSRHSDKLKIPPLPPEGSAGIWDEEQCCDDS